MQKRKNIFVSGKDYTKPKKDELAKHESLAGHRRSTTAEGVRQCDHNGERRCESSRYRLDAHRTDPGLALSSDDEECCAVRSTDSELDKVLHNYT